MATPEFCHILKKGVPPYTGAKSPYFTTKTPYIILNNKANFIAYDTYF